MIFNEKTVRELALQAVSRGSVVQRLARFGVGFHREQRARVGSASGFGRRRCLTLGAV
ncbi:MAG: hypothetical protein MSH49_09680 [[Eubacterium] saphenum]|nr:hypothetical protein [[Eubacterium] saphenum]